MKESIGAGKFGEVWRARAHGTRESTEFILKRLYVEKGEAVRLSGLREIYFGQYFRGDAHVCRFVESFVETDLLSNVTNLWLVFRNEGVSLRALLYEARLEGMSVTFQPSSLWRSTRISPKGNSTIRELMRQLLQGISECQKKNVTHRDIKPENLLVHILTPDELKDGSGGGGSSGSGGGGDDARPDSGVVLKLADFGSALNSYAWRNLYGEFGPSALEETADYAPPEVVFGRGGVPLSYMRPQSYDMWSAGVVFLELILSSSKVFRGV